MESISSFRRCLVFDFVLTWPSRSQFASFATLYQSSRLRSLILVRGWKCLVWCKQLQIRIKPLTPHK